MKQYTDTPMRFEEMNMSVFTPEKETKPFDQILGMETKNLSDILLRGPLQELVSNMDKFTVESSEQLRTGQSVGSPLKNSDSA